jgi:hypothetical protein
MAYWKNRAKDVILAVMRGALADGVSREEMLRRVDESYPFGPRTTPIKPGWRCARGCYSSTWLGQLRHIFASPVRRERCALLVSGICSRNNNAGC